LAARKRFGRGPFSHFRKPFYLLPDSPSSHAEAQCGKILAPHSASVRSKVNSSPPKPKFADPLFSRDKPVSRKRPYPLALFTGPPILSPLVCLVFLLRVLRVVSCTPVTPYNPPPIIQAPRKPADLQSATPPKYSLSYVSEKSPWSRVRFLFGSPSPFAGEADESRPVLPLSAGHFLPRSLPFSCTVFFIGLPDLLS